MRRDAPVARYEVRRQEADVTAASRGALGREKKMTTERLRSALLVALLLLAFALAGTMDYHDRVQDLSGHSLEQQ